MVNESESEALSGIPLGDSPEDLDRAAQFFIEKGVKVVVITLGERGAYCQTRTSPGRLHLAREVAVVDSTGAGDTFVGAFAAFLGRPDVRKTWIEQKELAPSTAHEAVAFSTLAASVTVQHAGAQDSIPWLTEVPTVFQEVFPPSEVDLRV
jgi:ribokinase